MKKISRTISVSIFTIALSILAIAPNTAALPEIPVTTVYIDKPTIIATSVDQEFTVTTCVKSVTNLYAWRFGMIWNSTMIECTAVTINYSFFGPEANTIKVEGKINNTGGYMDALAVSLTTTPPSGITGDGPLAHATFRAKATGTTDIHLSEVKLKDPATIPANLIDVYTVVWDGQLYPVVTVSNLTGLSKLYRFSNHAFDKTQKILSFNVTGPDGTTIFLNVTIPKALLEGNATYPWAIQVDSKNVTDFIATPNATHTSLYFTYTLSTHKVEIWVIPEFPTVLILSLLIITALAATILRKKTQLRNPHHHVNSKTSDALGIATRVCRLTPIGVVKG